MTAKPATPLPWIVGRETRIYMGATMEKREIAVATRADPAIRKDAPRNAAYIVAACNAYPELVAALRRSNAALKALHDLAAKRPMMETHLVTEAQTCGGAIVEATDLLAKLGEGA